MLTNDVVSFEQPGPNLQKGNQMKYCFHFINDKHVLINQFVSLAHVVDVGCVTSKILLFWVFRYV